MGKRIITFLAVVALVVAVVQWTPLRFLHKDAADFVWGLAGGFSIAAIVSWLASPK